MPRLGSFIEGQQQTYRPFRGKSCLSRNRNPVYFFGLGMLLWSLFCCCVATNHIYDALTMNIIADVLIVTRIPPHLSSTAIFLARQRGTCHCLHEQAESTNDQFIEPHHSAHAIYSDRTPHDHQRIAHTERRLPI